jgi:hypothetical protein
MTGPIQAPGLPPGDAGRRLARDGGERRAGSRECSRRDWERPELSPPIRRDVPETGAAGAGKEWDSALAPGPVARQLAGWGREVRWGRLLAGAGGAGGAGGGAIRGAQRPASGVWRLSVGAWVGGARAETRRRGGGEKAMAPRRSAGRRTDAEARRRGGFDGPAEGGAEGFAAKGGRGEGERRPGAGPGAAAVAGVGDGAAREAWVGRGREGGAPPGEWGGLAGGGTPGRYPAMGERGGGAVPDAPQEGRGSGPWRPR